jgi:hypothetical protein
MKKALAFLTSPKVVFYSLPPLMLLLILGTIAQRYIGLYEAEKLFFQSWILWIGPVPVPSTYPLLALLALGLLAKLLWKTRWNKAQFGIAVTHLGALALLVGGLITALTAEEGFMVLSEGEAGRLVSDYHQRELLITRDESEVLAAIPAEALEVGTSHTVPDLPISFTVKELYRNSQPVEREEPNDQHRLIAQKMALKELPLEKQDEANQHGIIVQVEGADDAQDGLYLAYEAIPMPILLRMEEGVIRMRLQKAKRALPFTLTLNEFTKFRYPGSDMAMEYESKVTVENEEGIRFDQDIRMNEPLRFEGVTLYQSSFIQTMEGEEMSVLAVVENEGYWFPYLASVLMAIGLIWQSVIRMRQGRGAT